MLSPKDQELFEALVEIPGRWVLFVHQGHVVKVGRMDEEVSAAEFLNCLGKTVDVDMPSEVEYAQSESSP